MQQRWSIVKCLITAVARLDKGEYVVKEATMAKLKSTKVADEAIYSCLQMLGLWIYGSTFIVC
jgi:alkylation response protein AidB-like acyl-CoA dehydrogenase